MNSDPGKFPELFGSMVFNEETMKKRLSPSCYKQWKQSVSDGTPLDISTANEIAEAMKQWAVEKGATHYTHWFQPMTGGQGAGPRRARRLLLPFRRPSRNFRSQRLHGLGSHFLRFY